MRNTRSGKTSTDAKREWCKRSYDRVYIMVPKGAREEIHAAARRHGMSMASYIRHLIIADNPPEDLPQLGGGVTYEQTPEGMIAALFNLP